MTVSDIAEKELNIESVIWKELTWVNIEKPTKRDTDYLAQHYPFHELDLEDCLGRVQRPKIDEYEKERYLFLVFHFPVFNPAARVTAPSQISIFIGERYLVTLHSGELKPLVKMFKDCQANEDARDEHMGRDSGYLLYSLLDRLVHYCIPILNKIGANIEAVEDAVFSEGKRGTVREISMLRRDVISYRRITKPQLEVFELLEQKEWPFLKGKEDPEIYFGDLADGTRKIQDTLDDYKDMLEGLNDTNNTLTSFRTNTVIRVLTIIATIMMPLTLIASIYGMNLSHLPLAGSPLSFPIMIAVMLLVIVGMLVLFRLRRWI